MSIKIKKFLSGLQNRLKQNHHHQQQYSFKVSEKRTDTCKLQIWNEQLFQKYYPEINQKTIYEDFINFTQLPSEIMGKKSSEITLSDSRVYCIKMITDQDLDVLQQIITQLITFKNQNNVNYFIKIYRVYIVYSNYEKYQSIDAFILMPNLRAHFENIIASFDIKGHCEGRQIQQGDYEDFKFGKDGNFIRSEALTLLRNKLTKQFKQNFLRELNCHCELLNELKIIDYSLFLVIFKKENNHTKYYNQILLEDDVYFRWEIIDLFQRYNSVKKIENKFKSLFKKDVSSVQPQIYYKRFIQFLSKHL